ncbi:MAG: glycosyltransferase [Verrucomicrobiota bacterium]|nr:glycosyltransferase [Verrucomicrobiota bacterium]
MPVQSSMPEPVTPVNAPSDRVVVDGKFFRLGPRKFHLKGVTYGPFAPNADGETFAPPEQTARDFRLIRELGANALRVYYPPPVWWLDLAAEHQLRVFVDIPWPKHLCFLDSKQSRAGARRTVRDTVARTRGHPAVFAHSVVNEIPADIVRWSGTRRVERFIEELLDQAKTADPTGLFTFTSFPPTEFLRPANSDFVCFNVYLHQPDALEGYLSRLQTLAEAKPLVLGEFGMDSIREGEARQSGFLAWQIEGAFRSGLAGTVVFSFTDDWFRGGQQIEDWGFGLTTRDRRPKPSFHTVQRHYRIAPRFPLRPEARVSVVVATYNGARTLRNCLQSLTRLNYPDYEVIVVDDGSTDETPEIAAEFPSVRCLRQANQGLSAARNSGVRAATGRIVAFTDDDCRVDEDWLYYLVGDLQRGGFAGIGGHNFLPPEDSPVAAVVAASPGGPAHVMLTDRDAEHVPGCNMAFYMEALEQIGLFDPTFRKAGDDVDVCWRLLACGLRLGFSPAGFVWHYRRSTVQAYLKQQAGYGEAEALLLRKHPDRFNSLGGGVWRGRIYNTAKAGVIVGRSVIYHGLFGSGFFQRLYAPEPSLPLMLCTTLGYHVFVTVPLLVLSVYMGFLLPVALASLLLSLGVCAVAAAQAHLPRHNRRFWSRPLIALLFFLQPLVRGWARFQWRLRTRSNRGSRLPEVPVAAAADAPGFLCYWAQGGVERYHLLRGIQEGLERCACAFEPDTGWEGYDLEITGNPWSRLRLTTVTEELELGRKNFRCRLETFWSFQVKWLFAALVVVEALAIAALAEQLPWLWLLPATLPLSFWFVAEQGRDFQFVVAALIDDAARRHGLVRLPDADPGNRKPVPVEEDSERVAGKVCPPTRAVADLRTGGGTFPRQD